MTDSQITMPVDSLSYSSFTQLLRNPLIFKLKSVLGVYDGKRGVSSMVGSAGHEALRFYYGGNKDIPVPANVAEAQGMAFEIGLNYLNEYQDDYINYGKTGSREGMLKAYAQAMRFYFAEEPKYHEILFCEDKMTAEFKTDEGDLFPLPSSGVPDLVHQTETGEVDIIDTKFVKSFTSHDTEDYIKIVQAMFLYYLLKDSKGVRARRAIFREIKYAANKDGGPQIQDYSIPFDHEPYHVIFQNLYKDVVRYLSMPGQIYLPNLSDPFDGEQAGLLYAQGLLSADMSDVEVMHKVADVARVHKSFVASRLDRAENNHLPPEERIRIRLADFGIPLEPAGVHDGPSVIQYRFKVSAGVRMSTIQKHKDDIAAVLEAKSDIRILTPIRGTSLIGIEVEKDDKKSIKLTPKYMRPFTLDLPLGIDVSGETWYVPLAQAPHLLIGGTTGSGKSVLIHNLITSITAQQTPERLELILIDPKRVELAPFARKKHLHGKKVIFEYRDAVRALLGLADEMERRYQLLEKAGKRDIEEYNAHHQGKHSDAALRYIVVVIDEWADLILTSKKSKKENKKPSYNSKGKDWLIDEARRRGIEYGPSTSKDQLAQRLTDLDAEDELNREDADVEFLVVRLAQMARAVGIHLIVATQRPSTDVITGLIKANFPTRIALTTASPVDSEVILGTRGAEKLGGKGDMLFRFPANKGDVRLQGFSK